MLDRYRSALFLLVLSGSKANAWEANYPSGPVRHGPTHEITRTIIHWPRTPHANDKEYVGEPPELNNLFRLRTISYPAIDGADLGLGWDYLQNRKAASVCIDFDPVDDK